MVDLMTYPEAAAFTGIPEATLRRWRHTGTGPRSARIGKHVYYRRADILEWLNTQFA